MVQPKALKKYWAEKNKTKSLDDKCSSCGKSKNRSSINESPEMSANSVTKVILKGIRLEN